MVALSGCTNPEPVFSGADPLTIEGARAEAAAAGSDIVLAALEDDELSEEEYVAIVDAYVLCASELDRTFEEERIEDPINGHRIYAPYVYSGAPEDEYGEAFTKCAEDLNLIELAYINQFEPVSNPIVLKETSECLVALGYELTGEERNFLDFQEIPELDVNSLVGCGAESSFKHWPNIPFSIG